MHLAIEILGAKFGGGATVALDLLAAAIEDRRFSRITLFCSPQASRMFSLPEAQKLSVVECRIAESNRLYRWWWLRHGLPRELARVKADALLSMCGAGLGGARPHVPFIQQSLPFSTQITASLSFLERLRLRMILRGMKDACQTSNCVLVQTHIMAAVVTEAFCLPPTRVKVITPCVRQFQLTGPCTELDGMRKTEFGMRLLYVGNNSAYKNVEVLFPVLQILRKRYHGLTLFLTWPTHDSAQLQDGVVCLGYLNGDALAEAYQLADIFIMPSIQETVALPLLEAMSAGTPIVAADRPYAREVCGDSALFFDPNNIQSLVDTLVLILNDRALRERLARLGLDLARQRRAELPYKRMLDAIVDYACTTP